MGTENEYGGDQIQILEGLEAVRKRPGMFQHPVTEHLPKDIASELCQCGVDDCR